MAASGIRRLLLRRPTTYPQVVLGALLGAGTFFALSFFVSGKSWTDAGLVAGGFAVAFTVVPVVRLATRRYDENTERIVRGHH